MPDQLVRIEDAAEFSDIFEETHILIYRYVFAMLGGPKEEVEDITSETFYRAWRARKRFEGGQTSVLPWLLRIAKNLVIDRIRTKKRTGLEIEVDPEHHPDSFDRREIETILIVNEDMHRAWKMILDLPDKQKEIMVMRYFLDLPVKTIADHVDMVENTVSVTIRRVIKRIRLNWESNNEIDSLDDIL